MIRAVVFVTLAGSALHLSPQALAAPDPVTMGWVEDSGTLTLKELRTLPDPDLARRLFGDLGVAMTLRPRDAWQEGPFRIQPETITAAIRPRPSEVDGICALDEIDMIFVPTDAAVRPNPAMVLRQIRARTRYFVEDEERALDRNRPAMERRRAGHASCASVKANSPSGAPADNGFQFALAIRLVQALGDAARAGGPAPAPLDCAGLGDWGREALDPSQCLVASRGLAHDSVDWVQNCNEGPSPGSYCLQILSGEWWIRFDLDSGSRPLRIIVSAVEDTSSIQ
ncbi:hypothetical protein [Sphingosinicella sp. BN140058]|uniref:hypothetical protein n=1 Tax=Sphingosinicella sp. BN140058 TaxID=1892855 RepID=UPI001012032E|nr:hypothetical protein [Sphingosinicella sp. BN140058]QAY76424.1 hypothetical protein ETR14_07910 [Sphingosinicella sp. BN140058]